MMILSLTAGLAACGGSAGEGSQMALPGLFYTFLYKKAVLR